MEKTQSAHKSAISDRPSVSPLQLSHEQLTVVLAGIADGITALNPTGELVYCNDIAARLIGYPSAQVLLALPNTEILSKFELFDEAGQPLPVEELPSRRALRGLTEPPRVLRFRERETGEERWSMVTAQAVVDEAGQVEFAVTIFHDITELKRIEFSQGLLAQAGILLGTSLNYESRLENIARLLAGTENKFVKKPPGQP